MTTLLFLHGLICLLNSIQTLSMCENGPVPVWICHAWWLTLCSDWVEEKWSFKKSYFVLYSSKKLFLPHQYGTAKIETVHFSLSLTLNIFSTVTHCSYLWFKWESFIQIHAWSAGSVTLSTWAFTNYKYCVLRLVNYGSCGTSVNSGLIGLYPVFLYLI